MGKIQLHSFAYSCPKNLYFCLWSFHFATYIFVLLVFPKASLKTWNRKRNWNVQLLNTKRAVSLGIILEEYSAHHLCNIYTLHFWLPFFSFFPLHRFSQGQQLVTKLVTAPVACGAVMVPSTMLMGQVVTAYPTFAPQQQPPQTLSVTQPPPSSQEQQLASVQQPSQAQLTQPPQQFLQVIPPRGSSPVSFCRVKLGTQRTTL